MAGDHLGMTRREMEREVAWMLRRVPNDPQALAKMLADLVVHLIDKNNTAMATTLSQDADPDEDGRGL